MKPRWIAFGFSEGEAVSVCCYTEEQARKQAEEWIERYQENIHVDGWSLGIEDNFGYAEVKAVSIAVGPKTTDYRIVEFEQPVGKVERWYQDG